MTGSDTTRAGVLADPLPEPVRDRLLWGEGLRLTAGHRPDTRRPAQCADPAYGELFPCSGRRLAVRATVASADQWHRRWTTRHDLQPCRHVLARASVARRNRIADPRGGIEPGGRGESVGAPPG